MYEEKQEIFYKPGQAYDLWEKEPKFGCLIALFFITLVIIISVIFTFFFFIKSL
jgi:hypothetical protein